MKLLGKIKNISRRFYIELKRTHIESIKSNIKRKRKAASSSATKVSRLMDFGYVKPDLGEALMRRMYVVNSYYYSQSVPSEFGKGIAYAFYLLAAISTSWILTGLIPLDWFYKMSYLNLRPGSQNHSSQAIVNTSEILLPILFICIPAIFAIIILYLLRDYSNSVKSMTVKNMKMIPAAEQDHETRLILEQEPKVLAAERISESSTNESLIVPIIFGGIFLLTASFFHYSLTDVPVTKKIEDPVFVLNYLRASLSFLFVLGFLSLLEASENHGKKRFREMYFDFFCCGQPVGAYPFFVYFQEI
jgi:hypothetical protein